MMYRAGEPKTYWETVAETKWGQYLSEIEERYILEAQGMLEHPTLAIEIGCEGGRWVKMLSDLGWKMQCSDIDQESLDICKGRVGGADCILVKKDDEKLPFTDRSTDLLLCIEVAPIIQRVSYIKEFHRVLNDEGLFVGVFWNVCSFRGFLCWLRDKTKKTFVWYSGSYRKWRKELTGGGFNVMHEEGFGWFPFKRDSNSFLVPFSIRIEKILGLRRFVKFSPMVVFIARKTGSDKNS